MRMFPTRTQILIGGGIVLLVCLLVVLLFRTAFSPTMPSSQSTLFVATDQTHFHTITWQQKADGTLAGQWTMFTQQAGRDLPEVTTLPPVQGQITDQTITLEAGTRASLQGTIDQNTIQGTTIADGLTQSLTWYAATSDQSDDLVAAFTKYEHLQVQLSALQQTVAHPPADSDPASYALQLQNAQTTVTNLQQRASDLQKLGTVCGTGELALFEEQYPPPSSTFILSAYPTAQQAAAHSTLALQEQAVETAWHLASNASLPHVEGLRLPWLISAGTYQAQAKPAQKAVVTLQQLLQIDYQNMATFQQQAQVAGAVVQQLRQAGGC